MSDFSPLIEEETRYEQRGMKGRLLSLDEGVVVPYSPSGLYFMVCVVVRSADPSYRVGAKKIISMEVLRKGLPVHF
jgi:hypothetical protein